MRTLALLARKGGTGKTTLAVHLAVLAAETGRRVLLVDTDPQRSAAEWWRVRRTDEPRLVECPAARVPEVLEVARRDGLDLVVIDTRPSVEADTVKIARLSDMVLIPTRPGILDLRAIAPTTEVLRPGRSNTASMIVLNAVPAGRGAAEAALTSEARQALETYGLAIAGVAIGQRAAFASALIDGRSVTEFDPNGKAASELRRLFSLVEVVLWPVARR